MEAGMHGRAAYPVGDRPLQNPLEPNLRCVMLGLLFWAADSV
jgi:hypothetical protein